MAEEVLIIGNGVAGATAALTVRARSDARVTLLSAESPYFFSRTALMYALMDRMTRRDLEPYERASWSAKGIARVQGRATDLDARARTVTLDDGRALPWDKLLLATGSVPRRLPVEGADRAHGVVGFVSMQDLDACERWIPSTREAVVIGGGLIGVELVECLLHHGVRTTFLVREPWYWPAALCEEEGAMIAAHLRAHGVDLRLGAEAARIEVDAEGRCAGVVLRDGGVLPAQLVGACIGVEPAVGWLRQVTTPPALARGVRVDETLRASLPGVWSAGDCAEFDAPGGGTRLETIWYAAKRQGALAGENMSGRPRAYRPPTFFNSAKFFDIEYTTAGELLDLPAHAQSLYRRHPSRAISQRIAHVDGRVVGFNMLGSRWDHAALTRWIDEERRLDWVLAHLADAQFDVEFGRAPLGDFDARPLAVVGRPQAGRSA